MALDLELPVRRQHCVPPLNLRGGQVGLIINMVVRNSEKEKRYE